VPGEVWIKANTIVGNEARSGGGVSVEQSDCVAVANNTLARNQAELGGGGLYLESSTGVQVFRNTVTDNVAKRGGGIHVAEGSGVVLANNLVAYNDASYRGGGLFVDESTSTMLEGNLVTVNTGMAGGGLFLEHSHGVMMANTVIAGNECASWDGHGLTIYGSSADLMHTTLASNGAGGQNGSGLYATGSYEGEPSTVRLTNTIVVSQPVGVFASFDATVTLESTLWGLGTWANGEDWSAEDTGSVTTGTHNFHGDPGFRNPPARDFHIGPDSDAIDRGVDARVIRDIDAQPRPHGEPDLGADEYWPAGVLRQIFLPLAMRGSRNQH
jgi:parallel beta-helix repeat protein